MENIKFRPLIPVKSIIESMGMEISHLHDDLVFINHNAYLLRFDDHHESNLFVHFNTECKPKEIPELLKNLELNGKKYNINIVQSTDFQMSQQDKEEIRIEFLEG